ncbi:MAG: helix-turn-helix domain-containing protein [Acidimicrobiales bacterium]
MSELSDQAPGNSALDGAMSRVGDRWTLLVIDALLDGPRRFNELTAAVPGLASNILSSRLRRLEREGLVVAVPYSERPARYETRPTTTLPGSSCAKTASGCPTEVCQTTRASAVDADGGMRDARSGFAWLCLAFLAWSGASRFVRTEVWAGRTPR